MLRLQAWQLCRQNVGHSFFGYRFATPDLIAGPVEPLSQSIQELSIYLQCGKAHCIRPATFPQLHRKTAPLAGRPAVAIQPQICRSSWKEIGHASDRAVQLDTIEAARLGAIGCIDRYCDTDQSYGLIKSGIRVWAYHSRESL